MKWILFTLAFAGCGAGHQGGDASTQPAAPGTAPAPAQKGGMLQIKGSDTMVNLAQAWAEEYHKVAPDVAIAVSGGGSGTGIAALENGTVDAADASREIKPEEKDTIVKNTGKQPVEVTVAYDGLAVFVHKDNPIQKLTKGQLADIYGEQGKATKWTDLGVEVPGCAGQEIVRVSRQNNSGSYEFFREWTLGKGDFKLGSRDMQGSKDVVDLVSKTPCAIGYSGMGYATPDVKVACVASDDTSACATPSITTVLDKSYPISRGLYMYTLGDATGALGRYIQWIKSDQGQAIVEKAGFVPLPKDQRAPVPQ
jgi:phosphate transport system substrate-binding protein